MIYRNILLTGAAGQLGQVLRAYLAPRVARLRSTDIQPMANPAPNEELVQADLGDPTIAAGLVEGMDAILHFGGLSGEADFADISRVNIDGMGRLYHAGRAAGVRRTIFASSVHAVGFHEQTEVIDARSPTRPDSNYGVSKVFGEALAQLFWDKYGIETVSIRIGSCFPEAVNRRHLKTWLSYGDLCQLVDRSLTVPRVGHTIVFATSANRESFWDNRYARHLGYVPEDSADGWAAGIRDRDPAPSAEDVANRYQGGTFVE